MTRRTGRSLHCAASQPIPFGVGFWVTTVNGARGCDSRNISNRRATPVSGPEESTRELFTIRRHQSHTVYQPPLTREPEQPQHAPTKQLPTPPQPHQPNARASPHPPAPLHRPPSPFSASAASNGPARPCQCAEEHSRTCSTVVCRPLQWPHLILSTMFALRPSGVGQSTVAPVGGARRPVHSHVPHGQCSHRK